MRAPRLLRHAWAGREGDRATRAIDPDDGACGARAAGHDSAISALAVIIIAVTLTGAITYEVLKRREDWVEAKRLHKAAEEECGSLVAIEAAE